jgi:pSer/pThr/pTyr-binding forkhead associated (FHA) protein
MTKTPRARIFCPVGEVRVDRTFGAEAVLGRSPQVTIELTPRLLSAQHARIFWDDDRGCYMIEDLNSSNGTRLDGEVLREPRALGHMHVITLAENFDLVFQDLDRCAARHATPTPTRGSASVSRTAIEVLNLPLPGLLKASETPAREKTLFQRLNLPLPDLLRGRAAEPASPFQVPATDRFEDEANVRQAAWWIELLDLETGPHRVRLKDGESLVGRSSDCDVVITGSEASRRHARLTVREGRLFVLDLGSSNRTFIDDDALETEVELSPGQRLRFGAIAARVVVGRMSEDGKRLLEEGESE